MISFLIHVSRATICLSSIACALWVMNALHALIIPFKGYSLELSYNINACLAKVFYLTLNYFSCHFEGTYSNNSGPSAVALVSEDNLLDGRKNLLLSVRKDGIFDLYSVQTTPPPKGLKASYKALVSKIAKALSPLSSIMALVVLLFSSQSCSENHQLGTTDDICFEKALNRFKERYQPIWLSSAFHPQDVSVCSLKKPKTKKSKASGKHVTQAYDTNPSIAQAVHAIVDFQNIGALYIYVIFSGPKPYLQRHAVSCLPPTTSALSIWLDGLSRCQYVS